MEKIPYPITAGLDYYKQTMSQLAYEQEPNTEVTFSFKNRGRQRLLDYVDINELQDRFDNIRNQGFTRDELNYLSGIVDSKGGRVFYDEYLEHLRTGELPAVELTVEDDDIAVHTTGNWSMATFWETVVMSEINEAYFEGYVQAHGIKPEALYDEGDRRLSQKIAALQAHPEIKIAEFGTRRHFSHRWQNHVMSRLLSECPQNVIGTSNIALAHAHGVKPIGTFAHEMPMVYAALADARGEDVRASHGKFLDTWFDRYQEDLSIALTDTFTTEFFFSDFTPEQAEDWKGVRHDSGDPYDFGEKLIEFYEAHDIDPRTKTCVFSDGLYIETILKLNQRFYGRINLLFGWGTTLTNDMGIEPLSIVMKATDVRDADGNYAETVKLSDNPEKHTGPQWLVDRYAEVIFVPNVNEEIQNERVFVTA